MRTGNLIIVGFFALMFSLEAFYIAGMTVRAGESRDLQNYDLANKSIQLKTFEFMVLHPPVPAPSPKATLPGGQSFQNL